VLAKGKLEADGYIKTLEDQLTAMREDLGKQEYSKQLLDQLQNKATAPTNVNTVAPQTIIKIMVALILTAIPSPK
jgi:hypothetical protein